MTPLFGVILQTLLSCSNTAELTTYYGVPLGTLKHPALGIRGEIYLADDHTIVLDKFTHKPQITGCTAITLGPARLDDLQRKVGDGILLPYTTPNFSWEETRRHRHRTRRSADSNEKSNAIKPLKRILKYGIHATANSTFHEASPTPPVESATFAGIDESYEEIEYVEDEEETEEREESFNRLLPTLKDGETGHREATSEQPITPELISDQSATSQQSITQEKSTTEEILTTQTTLTTQEQSRTPTTIRSFPTLVTEQSNAPKTTDVPMIVFDKADKIRLQHEMDRPQPLDKQRDFSKDISMPTSSTAIDEQVAFLLTNGARLGDYKWIGIYDHCNKQSIPLISLDDVDPPREEEVGPMIGTARSITSGPVRIFNCNTILVPDLHFDADREFPRTFFYVGVGNVTKPLQQSKARTIGYDFDEPLEKHSGDDVMIRLPQGVRTFDVDFLSIYNENERKSYGFVVLPSLLVPPCVDEM